MTMTLDQFQASVIGKKVGPGDSNGQCVGLYAVYMSDCLGLPVVSTNYGPHSGYAIGIWDSGQPPAGIQAISGAGDIRRGDIVFCNWGAPFYQHSHVFIALSGSVAGLIQALSQNSPQPYVTAQPLPALGVAGVWRPTALGAVAEPDPTGATQAGQAAGSTFAGLPGLNTITGLVTSPGFWKRAGLFLLGAVILFIAVLLILGKDTGGMVSTVTKGLS